MQKLSVRGFGIASGAMVSSFMLVVGLSAWLFGWGAEFVFFVADWYRGFSPTPIGSVIGGFWGFLDGAIGGVIFAWVYNKVTAMER
jgi:hypothetical protein